MILQAYMGAARMQEIDPHGWTLSIVAVGVVFSALIILFILYSISGGIFTGRFKRKPRRTSADEDTAAAIALALQRYRTENDDAAVAIAAALHLYLSESVHDAEPGFITIKPRPADTGWSDKSLTFRKKTR